MFVFNLWKDRRQCTHCALTIKTPTVNVRTGKYENELDCYCLSYKNVWIFKMRHITIVILFYLIVTLIA